MEAIVRRPNGDLAAMEDLSFADKWDFSPGVDFASRVWSRFRSPVNSPRSPSSAFRLVVCFSHFFSGFLLILWPLPSIAVLGAIQMSFTFGIYRIPVIVFG